MIIVQNSTADSFEDIYLKTRRLENRIYTTDQIRKLPDVDKSDPHYKEWIIRKHSAQRFLSYIDSNTYVKSIMELGCGNGWFSNMIAKKNPDINVVGCDLNLMELEQADEVFNLPNLRFMYANIFRDLPENIPSPDLIVLPSSVQYFENLTALINRLWELTTEIHIIDSQFYPHREVASAKQRSITYYAELGVPEMAYRYYHHSKEELENFNPEYLYRPYSGFAGLFRRNPFPWVKLSKENG